MSVAAESERDCILASLAPLKSAARAKGLFLHCRYQDIWLTPDELDDYNARGQFLWGAVNWTVRDPAEHEHQLQRAITSAEDALLKWRDRVAGYREGREEQGR